MYYLNLEKYQADLLFDEISDSKSFIFIKLKLLEYLYSWSGNKPCVPPYICFELDKLFRVFMVNKNGCKMVTFGFEFIIKTNSPKLDTDNYIHAIHYKGQQGLINPKNISDALSILFKYKDREDNLYCDLEFDDEDNIADESKRLFEFILLHEPGYLRFDNSTIGYKEWIHPLNHFDINYSDVTYKVGLFQKISIEQLIHLFEKDKVKPFLNLHPQQHIELPYHNRKVLKKHRKHK